MKFYSVFLFSGFPFHNSKRLCNVFFMCSKNVSTQATPLSILWIPYMVDNLNKWVPKGILESDSVKIWQSCPRWILTKRKKNEKKAPTFQVLQNLGMTSLLSKLVPRKARKNRICFGSLQGRAIHTSLAIQYNTWLWVLKNSAAAHSKIKPGQCSAYLVESQIQFTVLPRFTFTATILDC